MADMMLRVPDDDADEEPSRSASRSASRSHTREVEMLPTGAAGRMDTMEQEITFKEDLFVERASRRADQTVALHANALSTIYVSRRLGLWDRLPWEVKLIFLALSVAVLTLQFVVTGELFFYQWGEKKDKEYFQNMVCITLLYAFLIRQMKAALQLFRLVSCHWINGKRKCLCGDDFWGVFLFLGALYDVGLHVCVLIVSMVGICSSKGIKDKLRISLAFFFLLEADEWVYAIALRSIGLLDPQDFSFPDPTIALKDRHMPAQNQVEAGVRWKRKGRMALGRVMFVVVAAMVSTYLYAAYVPNGK